MNPQILIDNLLTDTYASLRLFGPELVLCATIVVLLLARIFRFAEKIDPFVFALIGSVIALVVGWPEGGLSKLGEQPTHQLFTGMLVYDSLTVFMRLFLVFFLVLFVILSRMTGLADHLDGQDFYSLVLGSTVGMCLMASANHLIIVFFAIEMASVPSYVLAGIVKGRRRAGEASLKYAVYGAGAAGIMLYGISLLAGLLGTAHFPTIAQKLVQLNIPAMITSGEETGTLMVLALSALMIMAGLAFKLSAVPFHFWCPDVFEGATAEVDAFLSVASKAAALALLLRVAIGVTMVPASADAVAAADVVPASVMSFVQGANDGGDAAAASTAAPLDPIRGFVMKLLAIVAAVTCTFGNLAAYGQSNIKRMLAYSTIAHAGYMLMPIAAAIQLSGTDVATARDAISALLLYASIYLFMNLGAFAIVAFLRNAMHSEEIADYAGLVRSAPLTAVALTAILFSLIGLPPLAGFWAKVAAFMALVDAGGPWMMSLFVIGGINTVISLIYYLRVAKVMCIDAPPEGRAPVTLEILPAAYVLAVSLPVVALGILPNLVNEWARAAAMQIFS